jgi:hypothetical protein
MRKLCIDEVGGVEMKKKGKKSVLKHIFSTALLWMLLWLCI